VLDVVDASGGAALDRDICADMEARLGHEFGDVRVRTDAKPCKLSSTLPVGTERNIVQTSGRRTECQVSGYIIIIERADGRGRLRRVGTGPAGLCRDRGGVRHVCR
jgi:hypothetical protein